MIIVDTQRSYLMVKEDAKSGMNFVRYPYEIELFERQHSAELIRIKSELEHGTYVPKSCGFANVPKGKGAVRPGAILTLEDQIAYTMLVDSLYPSIHSELASLQGVSDFAYQLQPVNATTWYKHQFRCWDDFKNESLDKINSGYQFVVITDVTGCYENIDLNLLLADLRRIGAPADTITIIRKMLKKWSQVGTKGLPQGVSASHLLAKLYMSGIDIEMRDAGYEEFRFVDDIRIFCNSIPEAKKALMTLTEIVRRRGLNLQSAKSKILQAAEAKLEIAGKATVIDALHARLRSEIVDMIEVDGYPYAIEVQINTGIPNTEQLNIIKQAFRDYFLLGNDSDFDKSLFHYLLNKLGNASDDTAVAYCLDLLERHPEETAAVLKYLSKQTNPPAYFAQLLEFINSENAVYDYQNYQIIEWLIEKGCDTTGFKLLLRATGFDNNKPSYYRAKAKQGLGNFGIHTDMIRIRDSLNDAPSTQEKNATICSLSNMENSLRNAFLGEVSSSNSELQNACDHTRAA